MHVGNVCCLFVTCLLPVCFTQETRVSARLGPAPAVGGGDHRCYHSSLCPPLPQARPPPPWPSSSYCSPYLQILQRIHRGPHCYSGSEETTPIIPTFFLHILILLLLIILLSYSYFLPTHTYIATPDPTPLIFLLSSYTYLSCYS